MLDFLWSADVTLASQMVRALRHTAIAPDAQIVAHRGPWGVLVLRGQAYAGFDPVETDTHLLVVLGGPLPRADAGVAQGTAPDDGTRWILEAWKRAGSLSWTEDLVGHYALLCLDKVNGAVEAITDINSFVPLYRTTSGSATSSPMIGSHVDALALAAGRSAEVDEISVADFLILRRMTWPHTLYHGVSQLRPATVYRVEGSHIQEEAYWTPAETDPPGSFDQCAERLGDLVLENVGRICAGQDTVGLLLSGGEDSRVVGSAAARYTNVQAITFADYPNRETRLAERVAQALHADWRLALRSPSHYVDHAHASILLAESQHFFLNAHTNGLTDAFPTGARVLGGLMSGTFWKMSNAEGLRKFKFLLKNDRTAWQFRMAEPHGIPPSLTARVFERRHESLAAMRAIRPDSWAEWHNIVPATGQTAMPNLFVNRRLFPSYEPFVDGAMFRLCSAVPQRWKINRRIFQAAMQPLLESTRGIPHAYGFYPYYGLAVNIPMQVLSGIRHKFVSAVYRLRGTREPNHGPWPDWNVVVDTEAFARAVNEMTAGEPLLEGPLWQTLLTNVARGPAMDRFRAFQLLEWLEITQSFH